MPSWLCLTCISSHHLCLVLLLTPYLSIIPISLLTLLFQLLEKMCATLLRGKKQLTGNPSVSCGISNTMECIHMKSVALLLFFLFLGASLCILILELTMVRVNMNLRKYSYFKIAKISIRCYKPYKFLNLFHKIPSSLYHLQVFPSSVKGTLPLSAAPCSRAGEKYVLLRA